MHAKAGYGRRLARALAVLLLGVLAIVPSSVAQGGGGADRAAPTQRFFAISTDPEAANRVLLGFGRIHAKGVDHAITRQKDVFRFPHGSLIVRHQRVAGNQGQDPVTCLFRFYERGTYQVVRGTGDYVGAHGHGHYVVRETVVACGQQSPDAYVFRIWARGPLTL